MSRSKQTLCDGFALPLLLLLVVCSCYFWSSLDNLAICFLWLQQCYNDVCLFRPISCVHKLKDSGGRSPKWGSGQWTRPWSCEVKCQAVSRRKEHSEAWWKLAEIQVSSEPWRFWFGDFVSQLFDKGCKGYQGIVFQWAPHAQLGAGGWRMPGIGYQVINLYNWL